MRLINVDTLEFKSFTDDYEAPPYVILSHCWGDDEVTLQDILTRPLPELRWRAGWTKIVDFCLRIKEHPLSNGDKPCNWAWVDTCCIDKTSSAELSEAINSMFRWYQKAECCFVWLPDVDGQLEKGELTPSADFESSRWFTRGWTLQELLAPHDVRFFDKSWRFMGKKHDLAKRIANITRIDRDALEFCALGHLSIAQKMSWAADRKTTRREDLAYCLMGIFDVNMPLLYGEGDKAFVRLQEEIMKESSDHSILAWDLPDHANQGSELFMTLGALAKHPSWFRRGATIENLSSDTTSVTLTARGLQINVPVVKQEPATEGSNKRTENVALLSCRFINDINSRIGMPVNFDGDLGLATHFTRARKPCVRVPHRGQARSKVPTIFLAKRDKMRYSQGMRRWRCLLQYEALGPGFKMMCAEPQERWTQSLTPSCTMILPRDEQHPIHTAVAFSYDKYPDRVIYAVMNLRLFDGTGVFMGLAGSAYESDETVRKKAKELIKETIESGGSGNGVSDYLSIGEEGKEVLSISGSARKDDVLEISITTKAAQKKFHRKLF